MLNIHRNQKKLKQHKYNLLILQIFYPKKGFYYIKTQYILLKKKLVFLSGNTCLGPKILLQGRVPFLTLMFEPIMQLKKSLQIHDFLLKHFCICQISWSGLAPTKYKMDAWLLQNAACNNFPGHERLEKNI